MAILLCLAAGSALHLYQILTVLAWVARRSAGTVPDDQAEQVSPEDIVPAASAATAPPRAPVVHCPVAAEPLLALIMPGRPHDMRTDWSELIERAEHAVHRMDAEAVAHRLRESSPDITAPAG
jgi:hypothetical protein